MLSLIVSILALGLIIAFHEFGHFIIARFFGVGVIEYSIGMGPRIWSTIRGKTRYSLRALPIGGSCMMLGQEEEDAEGLQAADELSGFAPAEDLPIITEDEIIIEGRHFLKTEQFVRKPAWQRFFILLAGPAFNFLMAFVFALILTAHLGYDRPLIVEVDPGMPMAEAGVSEGDSIYGLAVGENTARLQKVETSRDIMLFMTVHQQEMADGDTFRIGFLDADESGIKKTVSVAPVYDPVLERNRLGFSYSSSYAKADSPGEVIYYSWYNVRFSMRSTIESIRMLVRGRASRNDVMGPVRMIATMDESVDEAADYGFVPALMTLLNLMIAISGSLGAMNLLPIPALDGGRLLFVIIEMILRRPVPRSIESKVHTGGMLLLLALMLLILFNDVVMLIFR